MVAPTQRQRIESYFGCPLFDWYGMQERVVLAHECEQHRGHHVIMDYGILELLEDPGLETDQGRRIVATGLTNPAMPLIRYGTEDLALPVEADCPCGRGFPLIRIAGGRNRDSLIDAHGRVMIETSGIIDHWATHIRQFQFVQDRPGHVLLLIVPTPLFNLRELHEMEQKLAQVLSGRIEFTTQCVDHIARTAAGKMPLVVSHLQTKT